MTLCMTREELRELTGYRQREKVYAWLKREGFRPRRGADRWPRVDRNIYEQIMAGSLRKAAPEPNFNALKDRHADRATGNNY